MITVESWLNELGGSGDAFLLTIDERVKIIDDDDDDEDDDDDV